MPRVPDNNSITQVKRNTDPIFSRAQNLAPVGTVSAEVLGGRQGRALSNAGAQLGKVAGQLQDRAMRKQNLDNRNNSILASSMYSEKMQTLEHDLLQRKGTEANGFDFQEAYSTGEQKVRDEVLSPYNKQVGERVYGRFEASRINGLGNMVAHEDKERELLTRATTQMAINDSIKVGMTGSDADFTQTISDIDGILEGADFLQKHEKIIHKETAMDKLYDGRLTYSLLNPEDEAGLNDAIKILDTYKEDGSSSLSLEVYANHAPKVFIRHEEQQTKNLWEGLKGKEPSVRHDIIASMPEGKQKNSLIRYNSAKASSDATGRTFQGQKASDDMSASLLNIQNQHLSTGNSDPQIMVGELYNALGGLTTEEYKIMEPFIDTMKWRIKNRQHEYMTIFDLENKLMLKEDPKAFASEKTQDNIMRNLPWMSPSSKAFYELAGVGTSFNGSLFTSSTKTNAQVQEIGTAYNAVRTDVIKREELTGQELYAYNDAMLKHEHAFGDTIDLDNPQINIGKYSDWLWTENKDGVPNFMSMGQSSGIFEGVRQVEEILYPDAGFQIGSGAIQNFLDVVGSDLVDIDSDAVNQYDPTQVIEEVTNEIMRGDYPQHLKDRVTAYRERTKQVGKMKSHTAVSEPIRNMFEEQFYGGPLPSSEPDEPETIEPIDTSKLDSYPVNTDTVDELRNGIIPQARQKHVGPKKLARKFSDSLASPDDGFSFFSPERGKYNPAEFERLTEKLSTLQGLLVGTSGKRKDRIEGEIGRVEKLIGAQEFLKNLNKKQSDREGSN